jgi:hypothetical protein
MNNKRDTEAEQPIDGFTVRCNKCGSEDIHAEPARWYSEETGGDDAYIVCRKCGQRGHIS